MKKVKAVSKTQLVREVVKETGISKPEAMFAFEVILNKIIKSLENGQEVLLHGVGRITFAKVHSYKSNMTGVMIPPHKRIKFKPNIGLARKIRVDTREFKIK